MHQTDWQTKAMKCTTKTAMKGVLAAQKAAAREELYSKQLLKDGRRKYNKKIGLVQNSKKYFI